MDGIHDLGGIEGFGDIDPEADEPLFHADWERRMWGLALSTFFAGLSNGGQFRHSIERMDAVHYLTSPYYEHWLTGIATGVVESGLVTAGELERRARGAFPLSRESRVVSGSEAPHDAPGRREPCELAVGARVRVARVPTRGHTRCPRYVRGRIGTIVRVDPPSSLPDLEAHGDARRVEPSYCVRFEAREVWGDSAAAAADAVHVDLWATYLEPVEPAERA
ncbi:MAG TPA: nitrile hydratase subunit beta [Acidimicrobiales bacterium]